MAPAWSSASAGLAMSGYGRADLIDGEPGGTVDKSSDYLSAVRKGLPYGRDARSARRFSPVEPSSRTAGNAGPLHAQYQNGHVHPTAGLRFDEAAAAYDAVPPRLSGRDGRSARPGSRHPGDRLRSGQLTVDLVGRGHRVCALDPGPNRIRAGPAQVSGGGVPSRPLRGH